ncbi:MAG: glycosyltransferase [Planctomycetaceae bacterium]|jgi:glycosyltransferase involved in cell wall biosynthesis|nr:glycosyltransferase [Planctomycetaceae bacterium]
MVISEKIHIALCITELQVGGAERMLAELAIRLDRSRFVPFVCSMKPRPSEETPNLLRQLENAEIPVEFLNITSPFSLFCGLRRLRGIFRERKPHICQSFLFHANLLTRFAAWNPLKSFAKLQKEQTTTHILSGIRVAEKEKTWRLRLDRWTRQLVEKYVCVSSDVAGFTERNVGISPEKIVVIPNGVDVETYQTQKKADLTACGCLDQTKKIIVIGRLHPQKGIDWLLQTTDVWLSARNDCELLLVGDGPKRAALERIASEKTYRRRIHFLGYRQDIPQLLAASDLLLLPSRWEGMPNVVLQAMASGLPVVATEVEGIDELIPQKSPQTCPFGNTALFAERILQILDNPELGAKLGAQNQERIRRHFDVQKMVTAYETLWEQMSK